jgi:hypothetical protein
MDPNWSAYTSLYYMWCCRVGESATIFFSRGTVKWLLMGGVTRERTWKCNTFNYTNRDKMRKRKECVNVMGMNWEICDFVEAIILTKHTWESTWWSGRRRRLHFCGWRCSFSLSLILCRFLSRDGVTWWWVRDPQ